MTAVIIATIAVSSIAVAAAYKIAKGDVSDIQGSLASKFFGKVTFTINFKPPSALLADSNQFQVTIKCEGGPCPADKVASYLSSILTDEYHTHSFPSATVKVSVNEHFLEHAYGNGKAKAALELKDGTGTTYTVNVKNDQATPKYPVIYCNGVHVDNGKPFLNTWFTSPTPIANPVPTTISWTLVYSVSLSQLIVKDGVTVRTSIVQTASLGQQVTFSLKDEVPSNTPPVGISDTGIIQVYLENGYDFEGWAVGFGIADPSGTNSPVMVVQGDAGTYYNFTPTPSYLVALASQNNTNKLVKESEITDHVPIVFSGSNVTVDLELDVYGNWHTTYPSTVATSLSNGKLIHPRVALQLVKRTVTSTTTVEEYA